jgi:hypothetical protein
MYDQYDMEPVDQWLDRFENLVDPLAWQEHPRYVMHVITALEKFLARLRHSNPPLEGYTPPTAFHPPCHLCDGGQTKAETHREFSHSEDPY